MLRSLSFCILAQFWVASTTLNILAMDPPRTDVHPDALFRIGTSTRWHPSQITQIAFSRDGGKLAVCSFNHGIRIWNTSTDQLLQEFTKLPRGLTSLAYDSDIDRIAVGDLNGNLHIIDLQTRKIERVIRLEQERTVTSIHFAPDQCTLFATGVSGYLGRWNFRNGENLWRRKAHKNAVLDLAYWSNGKLIASTGDDSSVRIWDATTGESKHELGSIQGRASNVRFLANGTTVAFCASAMETWDFASGARTKGPDGGRLSAIAVDGRGGVIGTLAGGRLVRWDPQAKKTTVVFENTTAPFRSLAISDGAHLVAASLLHGTYVRLWDLRTGEEVRPLRAHTNKVLDASFRTSDRVLLTAGRDGTIREWNSSSGEQEKMWRPSGKPFSAVAFTRDGRQVALADGSRLQLLDTESRRVISEGELPLGPILSVRVNDQGRYVAIKGTGRHPGQGPVPEGYIAVWDSTTDRLTHVWWVGLVQDFGVVPPDMVIACGTKTVRDPKGGKVAAEVRMWNWRDDREFGFEGEHLRLESIAVTSDGKSLIGVGHKGTAVWEIQGLKLLHTVSDSGASVALTSDSKRAVVGNMDGSINVWQLPKLQKLKSKGKPTGADGSELASILCLKLSPVNDIVFSFGLNRANFAWDVTSEDPPR